jgi:co-chaperonin GroES (HSP10)
MTQSMRPTRDVVVVGFEKKDETSAGGIILQESTKTDTLVGKMLGIGPDVKDVAIDDRIVADWTKGKEIPGNLVAIDEEHVQFILESDE